MENTTQTPSLEDLQARLAEALADNAALKSAAASKPSGGIKVAEKSKMVSLYGYGRFPVTVGAEAWLDIVTRGPEIVTFCLKNADSIGFGDPKRVNEEKQAERKASFLANAASYLADNPYTSETPEVEVAADDDISVDA